MKKNVLMTLFITCLTLISCQRDEVNEMKKNESTGQMVDPSVQSVLFPAKGTANAQYGKPGPYQVSTNAVVMDCNTLVGKFIPLLQMVGILDGSIKCSNNLPYGTKGPIASYVYYPSNIRNLGKLPVVNFVGGILSSTANYDQMMRLWASYGFVVVNSNDFVNSMPEMHLYGAYMAKSMNDNPQSPLFGKVDLSKMIIAGHSGGGQATLLTASIPSDILKNIDPNLKMIGALPIEPGPLAIGSTVAVPTLLLTGALDTTVPAPLWANILEYDLLKKIPAWSATAVTATHFSPTMEISKNEFAGISVAWLKYLGYNDVDAKSYFVGNNYKLKSDLQFNKPLLLPDVYPYPVKRNSMADALQ